MKPLIENFPREVGSPTRILVNTKQEFYDYINKYNGIKNIYFALYQCDNEKKYDTAHIDKIYFDLDPVETDPEKCCLDAKHLHNHLLDENIKHVMLFSGGGFQVFIFTKNFKHLKNSKQTVFNCQDHYCRLLEIDLDKQVKGDVARLARVPNTFNVKRRRYCISVSREDLEQGYDYIRKKAFKQHFKMYVYGKLRLDIKRFDGQISYNVDVMDIDEDVKIKIDKNKFLKTLPPCISSGLACREPRWRQRFLIITYLREKGYTFSETIQILKEYLKPTKFKHCMQIEHQPKYIYKKGDISFPTCERIKKEGFCPELDTCDKIKDLYWKP